VFTEFIMFSGAMFLRPRTIFDWHDIWYIARCLIGAAVMVPAVWALSSLIGIVPAVAYGLVVYVLAAYALQLFTKSDIDALLKAVTSKLGISDLSQVPEVARGALGRVRTRIRPARAGVALDGFSALTPEELDVSAAATEFLATVMPGPSWSTSTPSGNIDVSTGTMYDSGARSALATLEREDVMTSTQEPLVSVIYDDETEVDDQLRETLPIRAVASRRSVESASQRVAPQVSRRKRNNSQPTRAATSSNKRSGASSDGRRRSK